MSREKAQRAQELGFLQFHAANRSRGLTPVRTPGPLTRLLVLMRAGFGVRLSTEVALSSCGDCGMPAAAADQRRKLELFWLSDQDSNLD